MNRFNTDIEKQTICIDGQIYTRENIDTLHSGDEAINSFYSGIILFLREWWKADEETIQLHTSGSTGKPKSMYAEKSRMIASAQATLSFLQLHKNDNALLCMPMEYIAGKMMVVRAMVGGLNLICAVPSGHPLKGVDKEIKFTAMIPLQVFNLLGDAKEKETLMNIKEVIIGGGTIDRKIEEELSSFPNNIWSTYGMTETLSHVAMRKITGSEQSHWYTPMEGIKVSLTTDNSLIIDAPKICPNKLITNDIAQLRSSGQFKIIGRRDNIINSGGIKIQIEEVENMLTNALSFPFMITSKSDKKFGEKIVLLANTDKKFLTKIEEVCRHNLPHYWEPKEIIFVDELPMTGSGKPDRAAAKKLANEK